MKFDHSQYRKGVTFIIRKNNKYLVMRHKGAKAEDIYFPGGGIEPGETEEQTVRREIYEELGITAEGITTITATGIHNKFIWPDEAQERLGFKDGKKCYYGQDKHIFLVDINDCQLNTTITNEIEQYWWVTKEELFTIIPHQNLLDLLPKIKDL